MPFAEMSHGKRRFLVVVTVLVIMLGVVGWLTVDYLSYRHDQQREACERAIDARQGQRTMWEYLVEQRPADDPEVIAFVEELDRRLPPYVCDDNNVPTPAYPPDPD